MKKLNLFQRFYLWVENQIMTRLVPLDRPGPVFKVLFKIPVWLYRIGLGGLQGKHFLLLVTRGRKTGKLRYTALEYSHEASTDAYQVMAGWGGRTDWYRNARANPRVQVQVGRRRFQALAEPLGDEEVAQILFEITQINPNAAGMWSRWAGEPLDGSLESLRRAAPFFPVLRLHPLPPET